jgi:aryl-alcohol dehydrogenase-like predicted oxidoreductase
MEFANVQNGDIRPSRIPQYLQAVNRLDEFSQARYGKRVVHLALRWLLDQPGADELVPR